MTTLQTLISVKSTKKVGCKGERRGYYYGNIKKKGGVLVQLDFPKNYKHIVVNATNVLVVKKQCFTNQRKKFIYSPPPKK